MKIGVLKEIKPNEYRVSATPNTVAEIVKRGHEVLVETKAGMGSGYDDSEYEKAGATIHDKDYVYENCDLIYKVKEIFPEEYKYLKEDKIVFTYIHSNAHDDQTQALLDSNCISIAYEDVDDKDGNFPMLKPMSILAGKGGFLAALHNSQAVFGGPGLLLNREAGISAPIVSIIGAGNAGLGAAELAAAFGNEVRILDVSYKALENVTKTMPSNVTAVFSNRLNIEKALRESDVIINCILWDKTRKDHLIYKEDLKLMKKSAIIVDVSCDDNGAIETCTSTTHDNPTYKVEGITHYCVDNIPSAFSKTASELLANATLPYLLEIANKGVEKALIDNKYLRRGLTTYKGKLTLLETAVKQNREYTSSDELVKTFE